MHQVFSVCCVFTRHLVMASNGRCSPYFGFLNYPCASATSIYQQWLTVTELQQSSDCSLTNSLHSTVLNSTTLNNWTELGQLSHLASERTHRERNLQHLLYSCKTLQRMWHILLLRVYGPLPSNRSTCYNIKMDFERQDGVVWTGLIWLKWGTGGGLLWTR
jgi:hypothetical protein